MPAIDHLVFVSPDVDEGVASVEASTGVSAPAGGSHAGRGTRNALLAFDESTYLEIIGIDQSQPEPAAPRPFGITSGSRSHLATFAVHPVGDETIDDVVDLLRPTGARFGEPEPMRRERPDGVVLSWRLTLPVGGGGVVPFVIDWGDTPNPAATLPRLGALRVLLVSHPDASVRVALAGLDDRIRMADGPPGLTAVVATPNGELTLR